MKKIELLLNEYQNIKNQINTDDFKEKEINSIANKIASLPDEEFKECIELGKSKGLISSDEDGWDFI